MSLHKDMVADLIALTANDWLGWEDSLIKKANIIARNHRNKILDAAVEAQERQVWHVKADKYVAIKAIQELKGE